MPPPSKTDRPGTITPLRPAAADAEGGAADDAALVLEARAGHVRARSELFRRHAPRLTALMRRLLGSTVDAEDAVQDTFVEAFADLDGLRDPAAVGGWLRGIAVHQAHRRFRRRRLLGIIGLGGGGPLQDATLEQLASPQLSPEARAELALLDRVLARMPAGERLAWMLRNVEGLELTEVAAACGCSLATAKRRIAAGQERVAQHVGFVPSEVAS